MPRLFSDFFVGFCGRVTSCSLWTVREYSTCYYEKMKVAQSCLIFCNSMDCRPSGSFVHVILQARMLEWVASPFSKGSSQPRDGTHISCIADRFFTICKWGKPPYVTIGSSIYAIETAFGTLLSLCPYHQSSIFLHPCWWRKVSAYTRARPQPTYNRHIAQRRDWFKKIKKNIEKFELFVTTEFLNHWTIIKCGARSNEGRHSLSHSLNLFLDEGRSSLYHIHVEAFLFIENSC